MYLYIRYQASKSFDSVQFSTDKTMSSIIGIDFGTTNTCACYLKDEKLELIYDDDGSPITPSRVVFDDEKNILIGNAAVDNAFLYPSTNIYELKRLIGQDYSNEKVQQDIQRYPFNVVYNNTDGMKIHIKYEDVWDETMSLEEVYSKILEYILSQAKKQMQKSIREAVITIPAYFDNDQRQATINTALLAGFKTVHTINEPTSAALAFQYNKPHQYERIILVYDFGGGTFDVSVVRAKGKTIKVLSTDGNCHLGGTDIDNKLVEYLQNKIIDEHNVILDDKKTILRLKSTCKSAKESLSRSSKFKIELNSLPTIQNYDTVITRSDFDTIIEDIIDETLNITTQCLLNVNLSHESVDNVLLVGGSTRVPLVKEKLKNLFGKEKIVDYINPDQIVAHGAAVYGYNLESGKREFVFEDVLSLSLGTDLIHDEFSKIIERNSEIPCERTKTYKTTVDNQSDMSVKIYQGERKQASQNRLLGEFNVSNLTEMERGQVKVDIIFKINQDGILTVEANEVGVKNQSHLVIDMKKNVLSDAEIQRFVDQAKDNNAKDAGNVKYSKLHKKFLELCEKMEVEYDENEEILKQIDMLRNSVENLETNEPDVIELYINQLVDIINDN